MGANSDLEGMSILVTGAAGGIGRQIASTCAASGAQLFLVDRDAAVGEVATAIGAASATVDLADAAAAARTVQDATAELGRVDGIVQAAGIQLPRRGLAELSDADWQKVVAVNLTATLVICRAAAQTMKSGSIINVGSISALAGIAGIVAYSVTKAAVHQLTRSLAIELAPAVRVNAVAPGYVETPLTATLLADTERRRQLEAQVPLGRVATPADIAPAVRFLLSPAAAYITGEVLVVDGGFTAR